MHALGPVFPCQRLRQGAQGEFPCCEGGEERGAFDGGCGAGEDVGGGVGGVGGEGGGEEGEDGLGEEKCAAAGG